MKNKILFILILLFLNSETFSQSKVISEDKFVTIGEIEQWVTIIHLVAQKPKIKELEKIQMDGFPF